MQSWTAAGGAAGAADGAAAAGGVAGGVAAGGAGADGGADGVAGWSCACETGAQQSAAVAQSAASTLGAAPAGWSTGLIARSATGVSGRTSAMAIYPTFCCQAPGNGNYLRPESRRKRPRIG
jgi:hypothetical protein